MAISQALCNSFKPELMLGVHDLAGDTIKLALYTSSATLGAATTSYSSLNEVADSGSYVAGGGALTGGVVTLDGTTGILDYSDKTFTTATITARGALIYNSTPSNTGVGGATLTNPAIAVLDFGGDKSSTNGDFTVIFPTADAANAIIRIA